MNAVVFMTYCKSRFQGPKLQHQHQTAVPQALGAKVSQMPGTKAGITLAPNTDCSAHGGPTPTCVIDGNLYIYLACRVPPGPWPPARQPWVRATLRAGWRPQTSEEGPQLVDEAPEHVWQ